ncbi:MAG: hypothetical protein ACRCSP_06250 [Rhodoglobus sp.]
MPPAHEMMSPNSRSRVELAELDGIQRVGEARLGLLPELLHPGEPIFDEVFGIGNCGRMPQIRFAKAKIERTKLIVGFPRKPFQQNLRDQVLLARRLVSRDVDYLTPYTSAR